jgi:hypothetical protein
MIETHHDRSRLSHHDLSLDWHDFHILSVSHAAKIIEPQKEAAPVQTTTPDFG